MPEAATFAHVVKFTEDKISAPWPPRASPMPERVRVGKVLRVRQKANLIRLEVDKEPRAPSSATMKEQKELGS